MTDRPDSVTLRVNRSALFLVAGLIVGGGIGFVAGAWSVSAATRQLRSAAIETAQPTAANTSEAPVSELVDIDLEGRPVLGPGDAPVTIVEYTDYGCPWCAKYAEETYPKLIAAHGDKIRYSVRNFAVATLHPQAPKAAEAAECAADQERFWDYHDLLFQNRTKLDVPSLKVYAAQLNLDGERFDTCLDSGEKTELVNADFQEGLANGVRGTPTFFLNGRRLVGAQPLEVFQALVNRESQ